MKGHQKQQLQQGQFEDQQQDNSESNQFIKTTKCGRKKLCDVCVKSLAKYTCPGCHTKSCSLACVNKHKSLRQCKGKADNTKYVQKNQIDEQTVRKDFQYVKSMLSQTDKVKKALTGVTTSTQQPKRFYFLRKQARSQYNIKLHHAPSMIQRHRENISFYYMKTKTIYWVIELLYYKGSKKYERKLIQQPQPDNKTILQLISIDYLSQQLLLSQINTQKVQQFDVYVQNKITPTQQNRHEDNHLATNQKQSIQRSKIQRCQRKIIQADKSSKLCQVLRNLNIYQFPTLILVHKSLKKMFTKWKKLH